MADHLDALRFAARQGARRPVEREVTQPDLRERVESLLQCREQRPHRRLVDALDPFSQVADLHRARISDADAADLRRSSRLAESGAAAVGAGAERHRPLHEGADVRLQRIDVLGQERPLDARDQTFERQVDVVDLDLGRLLVEQVVEFGLGVLTDRLVRVEKAGAGVDAAVPAVDAVAGDRERTLGERLTVVVQLRQVEVGDRAPALAARTHAAGAGEGPSDGLAGTAFDRDRTARSDRGDVEGEGVGRADVRLPEPAEEDAQHRVGVGGGANGGAGVGAHPLLVDDDRGR